MPETEAFDVGMHVEALVGHGVTVDLVVCDTSGLRLGDAGRRGGRGPLARPSGLAHDPAKLASALSDLLG